MASFRELVGIGRRANKEVTQPENEITSIDNGGEPCHHPEYLIHKRKTAAAAVSAAAAIWG
jgi:hypothetical protein